MSRTDVDGATPVYSPPPPTQPPSEEELLPGGEPSPRRRPPRFVPRSLNAQITAGVVGLVVVLVALIGGGTFYALRSFLDSKLDQQLQSITQGGIQIFRQQEPMNGLAPLEVYAVALEQSSGDVYAVPSRSSDGIAAIDIRASDRKLLANRTTTAPTTIRTADGYQLRVTVRSVTLDFVPTVVVVGLSTDGERETLHRLVLLEFVIGSAAVLIAVLATTYGVGFSLRRLRRVTTTAQEVSRELSPQGAGLDRRVPDEDPVTEVGQLSISFNTMLSAVETQFVARVESERRMRQFLADASHELRTPLTSIRGYAELARMQRAAGTAETDSNDNLDRIEFEGTRMSRLVEDLLMLARGDADDREPQRQLVELHTVLDYAVSGARAAFPARTFDFDVAGDPQVIGDGDQLLRVVRNLVTNAAVHTQVDRAITVRTFVQGPDVVVQVIDGGPGLSPDDAAHVFERFWRADKARTRARGGSGLGLSIVATIVRAHGGTVRFDSTVEGGSTVTVRLPVAEHA